MGLLDIFKKTHSEKIDLAYRRYNPAMARMAFPGGKVQVEKIIASMSRIYGVDLDASDTKKYHNILATYSDVFIRKAVTQSSDNHIATSLLVNHGDLIKSKDVAQKALAFVTLNMINNDFSLESDDSMLALEAMSDALSQVEQFTSQNADVEDENLDDPEYGLVVNKPIYTIGVSGSNNYLKALKTSAGENLAWQRVGSMSVKGINGIVDVYKSTLPSGEPYKTLYVNMYGAKTSESAPVGFCFSEQKNAVEDAVPVNIERKQTQVAPKRKSNVPIIVLSIMCVLLVSSNIAQFFLYREAIGDTERQLITANSAIEANAEKISDFQNAISRQDARIRNLREDSDHYNEIIRYAKDKKFGYATSNFRASTGVIIVDKDDDDYTFTLTANWSQGGTVEVNCSSHAAMVKFDKDEWSKSTTITVVPIYEGVSIATFSNDVDSTTVNVLIIVTD